MLPRESASHFPSREVQKSKISPARLLQAATTEPEAQTNDEARGEAVADSHKRFDLRPTDLASHHRLDEAVGAAATFVRRLVTPGSSGKSKQNGSNFVPVSQPRFFDAAKSTTYVNESRRDSNFGRTSLLVSANCTQLDDALWICIIDRYHGAIFHEAKNSERFLDWQKPGRSASQGVSFRYGHRARSSRG